MTNFTNIPTHRLPRNAEGAAERARREARLEAVREWNRPWAGNHGSHTFIALADRAINGGHSFPVFDSQLFEVRRTYAYAHILDTLAKDNFRRLGISLPANQKSWLSVDHIHPLSRGGLSNAQNLRIVAAHEDAAKGDKVGVKLDAITVPADFALYNRELGEEFTSI